MTRVRIFVLVVVLVVAGIGSWLTQPASSADNGALCEVIADHSRTIKGYEQILGEVDEEGRWVVLDSIERLEAQKESNMRLLGKSTCGQ